MTTYKLLLNLLKLYKVGSMKFPKLKKQNTVVWIKLSAYVFMLLIVGATMRLLVSEDSREYLKDFFGSLGGNSPTLETQKIYWCPAETQKITLISTKAEIKDTEEILKICDAETEPFDAKDLETVQFQPILEATSATSSPLRLDIGSAPGFFQIGDLPFKSNDLHSKLSKYR